MEMYRRKIAIGGYLWRKGEWLRAKSELEVAVARVDNLTGAKGRELLAEASNSFGVVCRDLRDFDSAKIHFDRAEEVFQELDKPERQAGVRNNRARLCLAQGDVKEASKEYWAALRGSKVNSFVLAESLTGLGRCFLTNRELERAELFVLAGYFLRRSQHPSPWLIEESKRLLKEIEDAYEG